MPLCMFLLCAPARSSLIFFGFNQDVEGTLRQNTVKRIREKLLMSKAELARNAGVSPLTIDRVEKGMDCRMETKRKIILALGYDLTEKDKVFPGD